MEYWFWVTLKVRVFYNNVSKDLISLKENRICEVFNEVTIDEIAATISNLNQRMQLLENANGSHFEDLL